MPRHWLGDTIAVRFVTTITLAFVGTLAMNWLFTNATGVWGRPSLMETGLLDRAAATVRIMESQPCESRASIAEAANTPAYRLEWHAGAEPIRITQVMQGNYDEALVRLRGLLDDPARRAIFFDADSEDIASARFGYDPARDAQSYFMGIELADGSWLMFTVPEWQWGMPPAARQALNLLFAAISILVSATLTTRSLARPVEQLAHAVRRFGTDPAAPPIPALGGPVELRNTITAFNQMQAQISSFVRDRTVMLAAISHDLRTPLTRLRLRAEFIEDPIQQANIFNDVDEMRSMVEASLTFFRDGAESEPLTGFDLSELLKSIADEYADQDVIVAFEGPDHAMHHGRPRALRRVFANLIENAIKYATPPVISLSATDCVIEVTIRDRGQGIPEEQMEQVFAPFQRLDSSRNRNTGGVGLGLTSARNLVRANGGEIILRNCPDGGLAASVVLPSSAVTVS
jgi:two-component system osmolarity sensor histidine kinase EnvZ